MPHQLEKVLLFFKSAIRADPVRLLYLRLLMFFSFSKSTFVNNGRVFKINGVVVGPGAIRNSRTFGRSFGVSQMFFFPGKKQPRCHSCKQTINHSTTTVPSSEIPTFDGSQTNVVYKIPCTNCSWCYIAETGRAFNTRKKEHLRNTKTAAKGSRIANHAWSNNHAIDFENASIIDKGTFRTRITLEGTKVGPDQLGSLL